MKIVRVREIRARLRARLAAWGLSEPGDTLIEVLIAALLVALIAAATFTGYSAVAHVAGGESQRAQASGLAEADQARLHGLTLNNLSSWAPGSVSATRPTPRRSTARTSRSPPPPRS